jgi:hypothetical protein
MNMKKRICFAIAADIVLAALCFVSAFMWGAPFYKAAAVVLGVISVVDALFGIRFLKNLPPPE